MNSKMDRRKQYTRMVLRDSLITLLKTKRISTITVKEICERADINRSTFYSHYKDQFDLLEQIEYKMMTDIKAYLNQYQFNQNEQGIHMTEKLLEYIASKHEICQTLLNENGDHSFEKRVMELARTFLDQSWIENYEKDSGVSEYAGTFVISGSIYIIKQWLENNMDQSPKSLARLINSVDFKGMERHNFREEHKYKRF